MTLGQAKRRQWIARWHRRIALIVCLWLVLLAVTGVLINHANDWGLDSRSLPAGLQSWWYGIEPDSAQQVDCASTDLTASDCREIFAGLAVQGGRVLVSLQRLYLMDEEGDLVEAVSAAALGLAKLQAVRSDADRIWLSDGDRTVASDSGLMQPELLTAQQASAVPDNGWHQAGMPDDFISWERFFLDLHAARFLGPLAKAFNDLAAVLLLLLAISGVWLYFRKRAGNGASKSR
jgi:hypothetical protein